MQFMKHHAGHILLSLVLSISFTARAATLLIGGTGSSEPLIRLLFDEFNKKSPGVTLNVVTPPLGSSGGIAALTMGRIDLAISARPLKPQEKALIGRHFDLASTPFVLVTNGGQPDRGFTLDELAGIYDGHLSSWMNGLPIRLVLRTRDDSDTASLESMSPAMKRAVMIADQRRGMVYGNDDMDTLELLVRTPGALGPTSLGLLRTTQSRLTALPLNGLTPSIATLKDGSYPWRKTLTILLPPKPSPSALKFADFLHSREAGEIMQHYDYLPDPP